MYIWDEKTGQHRDESDAETLARWKKEDAEKSVKKDELPPQLTKGKTKKKPAA